MEDGNQEQTQQKGNVVTDTAKDVAKEKVKKEVQKVAEQLGDDGRILLRQSGTEPVVRVMVEAGTDEICHACCDQVIAVMRRKGHIID